MQTQIDFKQRSRRRFRSFKYSVVNAHLDSKFQPLKTEYSHEKNKSIINSNKLRSFSNLKKARPKENQTIDATGKKDSYLKTFLSFMSKDKVRQRDDDKENMQFMALVPRFHSSFESKDSNFTFLDSMTRPIEFIQTSLHSASKELKNQKYALSLLRSEFEMLTKKTNSMLEEIQKQTVAKAQILFQIFRSHEVSETEKKLRNRKEVKLLEMGQITSRNIYNSLKERSEEVEQKIFNCQPFDFDLESHLKSEIKQQAIL